MKKLYFLILSVSVIFSSKEFANPVAVYWINEFSIDSSGWKMELHCNGWQDSLSLDGWFLISETDTAFFKNGIYFNTAGYLVITDTNLQSKLEINPDRDQISLFSSDSVNNIYMDQISFGSDLSFYPISAPKTGQSISRAIIKGDPYFFSDEMFLYLDNTPTFGFENDYSDCYGFVDGYVRDLMGNPIENVKVVYDYGYGAGGSIMTFFVLTNSSGYFKFQDYTKAGIIHFKKDNYIDSAITLQIWPDSTVTIGDIKLVTGVVEKIPFNVIKEFNLSQNFPNPFNNSTTFFYTLPIGDNVEIAIYDEKGALVQKLFSGHQSAGKYKVNWKADNIASGIYFYLIRTGSFKISRKAVLLK